MKWFKHDTNSGYNAKMKKLLMRYGVKGYGLYYYCIELIAGNLTNDNITFELEHDSQILAYDLKMDSREVEEVMQYCIKLELFEFNTVTQRIVHSGLIEMVDNTMSQHPCIKQIKTSENFKLIKETSKVLQQNRIEQNRTEENIKEYNEASEKNKVVTLSKESKPVLIFKKKKSDQEIPDTHIDSIFNKINNRFQKNNSTYYRNAKESKFIKHIEKRFKSDIVEIDKYMEKYYCLIHNSNDKYWKNLPFIPSIFYSHIDSIISHKIN